MAHAAKMLFGKRARFFSCNLTMNAEFKTPENPLFIAVLDALCLATTRAYDNPKTSDFIIPKKEYFF
jgi:hypothetical protein